MHISSLLVVTVLLSVSLPYVHCGPVKFIGFWQNNSTATRAFTNFAFEQYTAAGLVADAALGIQGLWFLE